VKRTLGARSKAVAPLTLCGLLAVGCGASPAPPEDAPPPPGPGFVALASPAGSEAMAPWLAVDGEALLLSWLEPGAAGGHRLLFSRLEAGSWSPAREIAAGHDFFANWADVPKIAVAADGTLWAHWLAKLGEDTYAYGIFLARSSDGGVSWTPRGTLHDDATPSEHGFVAYAREGGGLRAVWLDGRDMPGGGSMGLRTALLAETAGASEVLDDRVCECCSTDLVATASGPLAVYRDRSGDEIRDIAVARGIAGGWEESEPLHEDGWKISGCPVNGPAAAVEGSRVAVAWFTAPAGSAEVRLALSEDAGATFGPPIVVDGQSPLGRVDVEFDAGGAVWVSWLAAHDDRAQLRTARFVAAAEPRVVAVAVTGASRASGMPRLARVADDLVLAWVEVAADRPAGLRLARLDAAAPR
jgi:hypothetical protein